MIIHIIWVLILSQKIFIFLNLHPLCKNPGMVPQPPSSPPANSLKKYKMVNYFFCRVIFFPFMLWWTIIVVSSTPLGSVFIKFFPEKQLFANLPLRSQVWGTIHIFFLSGLKQKVLFVSYYKIFLRCNFQRALQQSLSIRRTVYYWKKKQEFSFRNVLVFMCLLKLSFFRQIARGPHSLI